MDKNLLASFVSSMDGSFVHEAVFTEDDLSYWEFVNSTEAQSDDDVISLDDDGFASSRSSISSSSAPKSSDPVEDHNKDHCDSGLGDFDAPQVVDLRNRGEVENVGDDGDDHCYSGCQEVGGDQVGADVTHGDLRYLEEEENVEDDAYDGDDGDEYGLDDELVPWAVSDKFGRQRMRKLGKRSFSKMNQTKRSRYAYVKPGCVRGKHGLGLKHSV